MNTPNRLSVNRADKAAAKASGLPPLFYSIKRQFGDEKAETYLRQYRKAQERAA